MLTVNRWRVFWFRSLGGSLFFFLPLFLVSAVFSSGFTYMGEDTTSIFHFIVHHYPAVVTLALLQVLAVIFLLCLGLHMSSSVLSKKTKFVFGALFFFAAILRVCSLYPAVAENWMIVSQVHVLRQMVQHLSLLPVDSRTRWLLQWLPFFIVLGFFIVNLGQHMRAIIRQRRLVNKEKMSIRVDEFDKQSRVFAIQGVSLALSLIFGAAFLGQLTSSFQITLPENKTAQDRPNVFIFASDSLRYDRLEDPRLAQVMPFLRGKLSQATLFAPMIVGVPRTFPSWVEIASGRHAPTTGIRSMFPSRGSRVGKKTTLFSAAQASGYSTFFVSDFAGDIFPRYPFGAGLVNAPTSNLFSLVQNGILVKISALQAVLTLPRLQRVLPSLLESAEIADSRLVAFAFSENLKQFANTRKPVFATLFFSSAHFPYASPGPWYGAFQHPDKQGDILFRKLPDQKVFNGTVNQVSADTVSQTRALYDGGLRSIDATLEQLFQQLQAKGWLKNSVVLFFGDHGENLYEGNLGMGHGDGVGGEFSTTTPLVILTQGSGAAGQVSPSHPHSTEFVRTIDIAPTVARRIGVTLPASTEGVPLLDKTDHAPIFPKQSAYIETGVWFTQANLTPEQQKRIVYPGIANLLGIDTSFNSEFYLQNDEVQTVLAAKERAWVQGNYRLVVRTTTEGAKVSLYLRKEDPSGLHDLLVTRHERTKYQPIAAMMLKELNHYLRSVGVNAIKNSEETFFYSENATESP